MENLLLAMIITMSFPLALMTAQLSLRALLKAMRPNRN